MIELLFTLLGMSHVDPTADLLALAIDALSILWLRMFTYAYTPVALIKHMNIELDGSRVMLIAPVWPRRHWQELILLLVYPTSPASTSEGCSTHTRLSSSWQCSHSQENPQTERLSKASPELVSNAV